MITVIWHDSGREPQCPPDPNYPHGIDVDLSDGKKSCRTELQYPAKRCGHFSIVCHTCDRTAVITTAGRPDDPRSVTLPCKRRS